MMMLDLDIENCNSHLFELWGYSDCEGELDDLGNDLDYVPDATKFREIYFR